MHTKPAMVMFCVDWGGPYGGLRPEAGLALAAGCWAAYSTATAEASDWAARDIRTRRRRRW